MDKNAIAVQMQAQPACAIPVEGARESNTGGGIAKTDLASKGGSASASGPTSERAVQPQAEMAAGPKESAETGIPTAGTEAGSAALDFDIPTLIEEAKKQLSPVIEEQFGKVYSERLADLKAYWEEVMADQSMGGISASNDLDKTQAAADVKKAIQLEQIQYKVAGLVIV